MDYIEKIRKNISSGEHTSFEVKKIQEQLKTLKVAGFTRLEINGNLANIEDLESFGFVPEESMEIHLVIDRFSYDNDEHFQLKIGIQFKWRFL